jgi:N-methylhydantoinase A
MSTKLRIGVDIGGTFTDVTVLDPAGGAIALGKTLSTPDDLVRGILAGIELAGATPEAAEFIIHGSTVVINALLERKGARTALVTTAGFRDVYEIGRINRPDSFNLFFRKHQPLIPRDMIHEIDERLLPDGSVWKPFDEDQARGVSRTLAQEGVESVAIVFLHSYANVEHERRMRELLLEAEPGFFVTASHELSREYREYERTSTTAANAYVGPRVSDYLERLDSSLRDHRFGGNLLIMQSSGGLCDVSTARTQCIQMMESGPAAGVVGSSALSASFGTDNLICFDMGGTTAKACVVRDGKSSLSTDYFVGGYNEGLVIRVPVIDIKEVGTGGGSLAWIDEGGGLHVGPESAGASPGPACYGGGGTRPTVTDANLVLGRLSAENFLGGRMRLDEAAAMTAIRQEIAAPLGMETTDAASGIIAIANATMANAVRAVTTERGLDPRDFSLVAYGGAGPMHAVEVARELAIRNVIVPVSPGHFSAIGMLTADLRREYVRTHFCRFTDERLGELEAICEELETEALAWLRSTGMSSDDVSYERSADMRYAGQEHAVTVSLLERFTEGDSQPRVKAAFDAAHLQMFSHNAPDEDAEVVSLRVSIIGRLPKPRWVELPAGFAQPPAAALTGRRPVRFGKGAPVDAAVYDRSALLAGNVIAGPAIVQEIASSTTIPPQTRCEVSAFGHLLLTAG